MLVKFFQYGAVKKGQKGHSGGGGAVKNYLLGKNFDKGEIREGATLFRGDPNETTSIINGIERQSYYKSLVLSFTESDSKKLDDNKLNEIIDDFNATMFPTFNESQYSGYWVKHMDKGRIELHGVYAEEELTSGYGLNVYVATVDKPLVDSWKDLINDKYDLDDPNAPMHKRARAITKGFELKKGYEPKKTKIADEELKNQIEKELLEYVNNHPEITNRDGIISAFEELDYKVERTGKNYISIEHPNKKDNPELKNLRFKSDIYSQDFNRSMLSKNKSYEQREYERKRPERIAKAKNIYDSSLQKRIERMTHRYRNIERKPLDNQLTHDLKQIKENNEPKFLKQMAEWQKSELKKIIGQTIEQIYKQHEHDQPERLVSLKELHQILIDDIDNQLKDEPLPQFDQVIADYENSKNHVVTVDTIEHDRRQAEITRLAKQEAELLAQQQLEQDRKDRLNLLASFDQYTFHPDDIPELEGMDYQALLDYQQQCIDWLQSVDDYAQNHDIEPYIENYQYYRATLNYLHESNLIEQKRIESERPIDPLITQRNELDELKHGYVSKISLYTYQTASNAVLEKIKQDMLDRIKLLDDKAEHELLTDKEKSSYGNAHRVMNTIDDILSKRELEPVIEPEIVKSDDKEVVQLTPDYDPEPTPEPQPRPEIANNQNGRYIGAVVKIDQNGLYQQVSDKIILHPRYANSTGFKIGEWIDFQYKDGKVQAFDGSSYDMSRFKTSDPDKTKTQDQNQGR